MPMSQTSEITAEKTPSYMGSPVVPQRIFDMFPKIQLIFVLCEPGPRTFSDYKYLMRTKVGTKKEQLWLKLKVSLYNPLTGVHLFSRTFFSHPCYSSTALALVNTVN